jgi:hypothetical protein
VNRIRNSVLGAACGAAATVLMTGAFWVSRRAALIDEIPPHKAVRSVAPRLPEPELSVASAIAHLLVGGGAGAIYGGAVPQRRHNAATGVLFGLAVWFVGYEGVMPAATDIEPAHRDQRSRAATILVAHIVFGAALGSLMSAGKR